MLGVGALARDAVLLLLQKHRVVLLPFVIREALGCLRQLKKMARAQARVADAERVADVQRRIEEILSALLSCEVRCEVAADASLIGGFVVQLGDERYDVSIAGKLKRMEEALQSEGASLEP